MRRSRCSARRPICDQLKRYRDLGVERVVAGLAPEGADKTVPVLDRWADLIRQVNG